MEYSQAEILQTVRMTEMEHLDIRTITLGLSLRDCVTESIQSTSDRVREKIERVAANLVGTVDQIGDEIGIRIANKRIAVTPVSFLTEGARGNPVDLGRAIDEAAGAVGVDFVGGYSALVHKGFTNNESDFLDSIPEALSTTERLCGSINAATTRAGINMDAVARVGRGAAHRLGIPFGIIELSLAPTPVPGDSVANILEAMGFERAGAHGTTAALALLTDAVKKGGAMASSAVGGMSGAFIPVSEDAGMIEAARVGALTLEKLEAWTSVCSVGLDMIAVPGSTSAETIAAIIADEMSSGVMNNKTTAVRIIPVPGKEVGELVEFGGLLGSAPIMAVNAFSSEQFIRRGGRIPAPVHSLRN